MNATMTEAACPKCGGRMWDNRASKRNPKQPDFKCRDRSCDGVIWPPRNGNGNHAPPPSAAVATAPVPTAPTSAAIGDLPGDPASNYTPPAPATTVTRDTLTDRWADCIDRAKAVLSTRGITDPQAVTAGGATLFIEFNRRGL